MIPTSALGNMVDRWKCYSVSLSSTFGQRKSVQVEMLREGSGEISASILTLGSSVQSWCVT